LQKLLEQTCNLQHDLSMPVWLTIRFKLTTCNLQHDLSCQRLADGCICWQKEEDEHLPLIRNFDDDDDLW